MEHRVGQRRRTLRDERCVALAIGSVGQRLTGTDVVERRRPGVHHDVVLTRVQVLDGVHGVAVAQRQDRVGTRRHNEINVSGGHTLGGDGGVGDRREFDAVEVDVVGALPVAVEALEDGLVVLGAADDLERTLPDRHLVHRRIFSRRGDVAGRRDHAELAGQVDREVSRRAQQVVLHRVVVDLLDAVLGGVARRHRKRNDRISKLPLEGRNHVVGGVLRTVVVRDPLTQRHLPRVRSLNRARRLRQIGEPVALGVEREQRIEHREAHQVGRHGEVVGDRIQAIAISFGGDPKDATDDRVGRRFLFLGLRLGDGRRNRVTRSISISISISAVVGWAAVASTRIGAGVAIVIATAGRSDHRECKQGCEQLRQQRSRRTRSHGFPRVVVGPPGPVSVTGATRSSTLLRGCALVQVG